MSTTHPGAAPEWNAYVEDFRRAGHEVIDWIAHYLEHTRDYPVLPKVQPGELTDALPPAAPERGESYDAILKDFDNLILPAVTHWNHPRFLGVLRARGSTPAILARDAAAALNTNGLHWKTSPAVAELEQVALGWLRQWMGLPDDFFGIIYDTASVSSMHALVAARELAEPEARVEGSKPGMTFYTSAGIAFLDRKGRHRHRHRAEERAQESRWTPNSACVPTRWRRRSRDDVAQASGRSASWPPSARPPRTSVDPVAEIVDIAKGTASGCTLTPLMRARLRFCPSASTSCAAPSARIRWW